MNYNLKKGDELKNTDNRDLSILNPIKFISPFLILKSSACPKK